MDKYLINKKYSEALESYQKGNIKECKKKLRNILKINESYPPANYLLSVIDRQDGNRNAAIKKN